MNPLMLRQIWQVIDKTQANMLLTLDDASLVQWLLGQFKQQQSLNSEETNVLNTYLKSKLTLIRDIAEEQGAREAW